MNFFKSVFSDDPDPPNSDSTTPHENRVSPEPDPSPNPSPAWSFNGLIQTLATKSESVIETYRRDLQEFGSGLRKEIEVAQGSLGTVGTAIDELGTSVLRGTAQIISQGRDAILANGHDSDHSSDANQTSRRLDSGPDPRPYSRFEAQVRALQGDPSTYHDEPEDSEDYVKWKLGFVLEEKKDEIEGLVNENGAIESIYKRVVPESVDHESFWLRYFYKVHKLNQAKDLRASLVKRAISKEDDDEDLSWDVEDDDDDDNEPKVALNSNDFSDNKAKIAREATEDENKNEERESNCGGGDDDDGKVVRNEEEDLGWDEIEDLSGIDGKKAGGDCGGTGGGGVDSAEVRKRLSVAEEDEDLSWDIEEDEDDDRPTKA